MRDTSTAVPPTVVDLIQAWARLTPDQKDEAMQRIDRLIKEWVAK